MPTKSRKKSSTPRRHRRARRRGPSSSPQRRLRRSRRWATTESAGGETQTKESGETEEAEDQEGQEDQEDQEDQERGDETERDNEDANEDEEKEEETVQMRGPLSAYFFFCNSIRDEVRAANPGVKVTDIAVIMAPRWRELSEEQIAPFIAMHDDAKAEHMRQMEGYEGRTMVEQYGDDDDEDSDDCDDG